MRALSQPCPTLLENTSVADTQLNHRGWISAAGWAGIEIEDFPHLKAWEDRMWARPAVQKGANVPDKYTMKEKMKDKASMEKYAAEVSKTMFTGNGWRGLGEVSEC